MEYQKNFYITFFSNSLKNVYLANKLSEFTIQLAQLIDLSSTDDWEVGLCEFSYPPPYPDIAKPYELVGETNALVQCDLITQQFVGSDYVRCLRTLMHPTIYCDYAFENIYLPVEKRAFRDKSILITKTNCKEIPFESGEKSGKTGFTFAPRIKTLRHHIQP
jgi:hypothetical protein